MRVEIVVGACDFCGGTNSVWTYPCPDIKVAATDDEQDDLEEIWSSAGSWVACLPCKELIDAGDQEALTARALAHASNHDPDLDAFVIRLHKLFFRTKVGEGHPLIEFQSTCEHPSAYRQMVNNEDLVLPRAIYCVLCGARLVDDEEQIEEGTK